MKRLRQMGRPRLQPEAHSGAGQLRLPEGDERQARPGLSRFPGRRALREDRRGAGRLEPDAAGRSLNARPLRRSQAGRRAVDAIAKARQPIIISGSGVIWSQAWTRCRQFVEKAGIPFYTTPQGRGVVPDDHPYSYLTMRSTAFRDADLIIVLGTRMNYVIGHAAPPRFNAARQDRPHRHRRRRDRRLPRAHRHRHRRRLQGGAAPADRRAAASASTRTASPPGARRWPTARRQSVRRPAPTSR